VGQTLKPDDPTQIGIVPKIAASREGVTMKTIYRWVRLGLVKWRRAGSGLRIIPNEDGSVFRGKEKPR
jgi:predicted site-specific integrase-resolvase